MVKKALLVLAILSNLATLITFILDKLGLGISLSMAGVEFLPFISAVGVVLLIGFLFSVTFSANANGWWRYVLIVAICGAMIFAGWFGYHLKKGSGFSESLPLNSQLTYVAWDASINHEYETAISIADLCISLYSAQAVQRENGLIAIGEQTPPVGIIKDANIISKILLNNVLNDVASCYWIKADSLDQLKRTSEAITIYNTLIQNYGFGRVLNPYDNSYWSPAQRASDRLAVLQSTVTITPTFTSTVPPTIVVSTPTKQPNVYASLPDTQTFYNNPSIRASINSYRYLTVPGTSSYRTAVDSNQIYRWSFDWCQTSKSELIDALQYLTSVSFKIDDVPVTESDILYQPIEQRGKLYCSIWTTVLSNWRKAATTNLAIDYFISKSIHDSRADYFSSKGEYIEIVNVLIQ